MPGARDIGLTVEPTCTRRESSDVNLVWLTKSPSLNDVHDFFALTEQIEALHVLDREIEHFKSHTPRLLHMASCCCLVTSRMWSGSCPLEMYSSQSLRDGIGGEMKREEATTQIWWKTPSGLMR